jgi:hypothetical protein
MKQNMNYINALPDFPSKCKSVSFVILLHRQMKNFLFSRIHDFSQNTEYLMFGEEYSLIKPPHSFINMRENIVEIEHN